LPDRSGRSESALSAGQLQTLQDLVRHYAGTVRDTVAIEGVPAPAAAPGERSSTARRVNSVCGDMVEMHAVGTDVVRFSAHVEGCAVCRAATEIALQVLTGISPQEAVLRCREMIARVSGADPVEGDPEGVELSRETEILSLVARLPARRGCASLPFEAALEAATELSGFNDRDDTPENPYRPLR
jgi:NifU-like protein involved in Fe-S cluster formation